MKTGIYSGGQLGKRPVSYIFKGNLGNLKADELKLKNSTCGARKLIATCTSHPIVFSSIEHNNFMEAMISYGINRDKVKIDQNL